MKPTKPKTLDQWLKAKYEPNKKKQCATCGKIFLSIPSKAIPWVDEGHLIGWQWECDNCDSKTTLMKILVGE